MKHTKHAIYPILAIIGVVALSFRMNNIINDFFNSWYKSNIGNFIIHGTSDYLLFINSHCNYDVYPNDMFISTILYNKYKIVHCAMNPVLTQKYLDQITAEYNQYIINIFTQEYVKIKNFDTDFFFESDLSSTSSSSSSEVVPYRPSTLDEIDTFVYNQNLHMKMRPKVFDILSEVSIYTKYTLFSYVIDYITGKNALIPFIVAWDSLLLLLDKLKMNLYRLKEKKVMEIKTTILEIKHIFLKMVALSAEIQWYISICVFLLLYIQYHIFFKNQLYIKN